MAPLDIDTVLAWRGRTVRDSSGEKIGTFGDVYLESDSDVPAWGGVRTGLFGRHETFVPLGAVQEAEDDVVVPFTADQVKDAPRVDPDVALTPEDEDRLYAHYGSGQTGATAPGTGGATEPGTGTGAAEVTRSEEEVRLAQGPMQP